MLSAVQRSSRLALRRGAPTVSSSTCLRSFSSTHNDKSDRLLIVGSGVAGSAAALIAAQVYKIPVTLLFAGDSPSNCNSLLGSRGNHLSKF